MLVSQEEREVQLYRHQEQGWDPEVFLDMDIVRLESIEFELPLAEVCRDVAI